MQEGPVFEISEEGDMRCVCGGEMLNIDALEERHDCSCLGMR